MKILAINGTPTNKQESTTDLVLGHFLAGCRSEKAEIEVVHLSERRILPCDCGHAFLCWAQTPGKCVHDSEDDVNGILRQMAYSDIIVFATPLYLESMTGQLKTLLDRTLPLVHPHVECLDGVSRHPLRALKEGIPFVLVSVCGHHEVSSFTALVRTFEQIARNLHGYLAARILRPHAMSLKYFRDSPTYHLVVQALKEAGSQVARTGSVDTDIERQIQLELIPKEQFIRQVNEIWTEAVSNGSYTYDNRSRS